MLDKKFNTFLYYVGLEKYDLDKEQIKEIIKELPIKNNIKIIGLDYFFDEITTLRSLAEKYGVSYQSIENQKNKFCELLQSSKLYGKIILSFDTEFNTLIFERRELLKKLNENEERLIKYRGLAEDIIEQNKEISGLKDVSVLELSIRSDNVLKDAGIKTILQLTKISEKRLKRYRNLGKVSVNEIKTKLKEYGFKLWEEV